MIPPKLASSAELAAIVHALEVQHAELELQNQELLAMVEVLGRSNTALGLARDRYRALYDVAPARSSRSTKPERSRTPMRPRSRSFALGAST